MAQDAAVNSRAILNSGEPMRVAFSCAGEDLAAAGMSCSDEYPCPVYLELSSVSSTGKKISLDGNLHGPSVTLYSVLLSSDDGGITWKEPAGRISGAALDQVQWLDSTHGWAAGETQVPLPRDPFFLITTDGGASWRRKQLTDDGSAGAIQRFWFDSTEHGELVVDTGKFTLYETRSGGESWNVVSQTSQMPQLRRAPALAGEDVDYRIGSDGKAKAFVIEKRAGEAWARLASFAVQVASCGTRHLPAEAEPAKVEETVSHDQ